MRIKPMVDVAEVLWPGHAHTADMGLLVTDLAARDLPVHRLR
ncbi:hypothetical protein OHA25_60660 (plasmid) [Nonomuraea sp. NBC_00507]